MADSTVVHIGENSAEEVALKLLDMIAKVERKSLHYVKPDDLPEGKTMADRKWILDTYRECKMVVNTNRTS